MFGGCSPWNFYIDDMIRFSEKVIRYTRNRIIHGYLGIDDDIVWSIITEDIPDLLNLLQNLKNKI